MHPAETCRKESCLFTLPLIGPPYNVHFVEVISVNGTKRVSVIKREDHNREDYWHVCLSRPP